MLRRGLSSRVAHDYTTRRFFNAGDDNGGTSQEKQHDTLFPLRSPMAHLVATLPPAPIPELP